MHSFVDTDRTSAVVFSTFDKQFSAVQEQQECKNKYVYIPALFPMCKSYRVAEKGVGEKETIVPLHMAQCIQANLADKTPPGDWIASNGAICALWNKNWFTGPFRNQTDSKYEFQNNMEFQSMQRVPGMVQIMQLVQQLESITSVIVNPWSSKTFPCTINLLAEGVP